MRSLKLPWDHNCQKWPHIVQSFLFVLKLSNTWELIVKGNSQVSVSGILVNFSYAWFIHLINSPKSKQHLLCLSLVPSDVKNASETQPLEIAAQLCLIWSMLPRLISFAVLYAIQFANHWWLITIRLKIQKSITSSQNSAINLNNSNMIAYQ